MSLEIISRIKEAEKQAEEIVENAKQEAKDIIAKAQEKARIKTSEANQKFGIEMDEITNNAEAQAKTQAEQIKQEMENQCVRLREVTSKNMNIAIDFVVKEIQRK